MFYVVFILQQKKQHSESVKNQQHQHFKSNDEVIILVHMYGFRERTNFLK